MSNHQELAKALKTEKARREYAKDDANWERLEDTKYIPDGKHAALFFTEKLRGFRIYRLWGWMEGFCDSYPDHFYPMFTFGRPILGAGPGRIEGLRGSARRPRLRGRRPSQVPQGGFLGGNWKCITS